MKFALSKLSGLPGFMRFLLIIVFLLTDPVYASSQNLLSNGGFESDFSGWTTTAANGSVANFDIITSDVHGGTKAMQAEIIMPGPNSWDAQVIHVGWPSISGKEYTLSFWAKAANMGETLRVVMQNSTYSHFQFNLSTEWKMYQQTFTAAEDNLQMKFHFFEAGSFILDDFSILEADTSRQQLTFSIDPESTYQEMIGFGGALSWYSNRVIDSPYKTEIGNLLFNELGLDILRLKNWYYPANYPTYTGVDNMETSWFNRNLEATKILFSMAKAAYPATKVLLSSWGPPSGLKSNNSLSAGTLKKVNNEFVYTEYAQYFEDLLDNVGFAPDWLSIQNEPGYIDTWTTCEWRPTETADFPGYDIAFDRVYHKIKDRPNAPLLLGGESENIGQASWDNSLNTFRAFTNPIKNHPGVYAYAYHLYNFYNSATIEGDKDLLNIVRDEFPDKPNIMTEFSKSSLSWSEMASLIQNTLMQANASGYVYWNMVWDEQSTDAMITIDGAGNYQVTEYYYLIKHFAKYINEGDVRIDVQGSNGEVKGTGFISNAGDSISLIITNNTAQEVAVELDLASGTASGILAYQSNINDYFQAISLANLDSIIVPPKSITSIMAAYSKSLPTAVQDKLTEPELVLFPIPTNHQLNLLHYEGTPEWTIYSMQGQKLMSGNSQEIDVAHLLSGVYVLKSGRLIKRFIVN